LWVRRIRGRAAVAALRRAATGAPTILAGPPDSADSSDSIGSAGRAGPGGQVRAGPPAPAFRAAPVVKPASWASNTIAVATAGRVGVVPVVDEVPRGFHWESRGIGSTPAATTLGSLSLAVTSSTLSGVVIRLGAPVRQVGFKRWTILVYDHNMPSLPRRQRP
jgi:hypothetical protein